MAKKMRRSQRPEIKVDDMQMTPMIDVVFQLLIYFLVTIKPEDVMAHLDVYRPQADQQQKADRPPNVIRIGVFHDGFTLNDRHVGRSALETMLNRLASYDPDQTILIMCSPDSPHEYLIEVLDLCSKAGLTNLSVMSR